MRKLILLLICVCLVLTTGCNRMHMLLNDKYIEVFEYQVPFASKDSKDDYYLKLDEDDYGRKLYYCEATRCATALSDFCGSYEICFYLILQDTDSDCVKVYDNDCYVFVPKGTTEENDLVVSLKQNNDWNNELNEKLMTAFPVDGYSLENEKELEILIEDTLGFEPNKIRLDSLMTPSKKCFYIVRNTITYDYVEIFYGKTFLFTIQNDSMTNIKELEGTANDWKEQIRDYKALLDSQE